MTNQNTNLLYVARENPRSEEQKNLLGTVIDAYIEHFGGDQLVAQVALVEDMFSVMNIRDWKFFVEYGNPPIAVTQAINAMSG